ncbi:hypothetical protein [Kluyvera ascorbata]
MGLEERVIALETEVAILQKAVLKKTADTDNCSPVFSGTVYSVKIYGELMKPIC